MISIVIVLLRSGGIYFLTFCLPLLCYACLRVATCGYIVSCNFVPIVFSLRILNDVPAAATLALCSNALSGMAELRKGRKKRSNK